MTAIPSRILALLLAILISCSSAHGQQVQQSEVGKLISVDATTQVLAGTVDSHYFEMPLTIVVRAEDRVVGSSVVWADSDGNYFAVLPGNVDLNASILVEGQLNDAASGKQVATTYYARWGDPPGPPPQEPMTAEEVEETITELPPGRSPGVWTVPNRDTLDDLWDDISNGGTEVDNDYPGDLVRLPDGTLVGIRPESTSGGATIDVRYPDGDTAKVHIDPCPTGGSHAGGSNGGQL